MTITVTPETRTDPKDVSYRADGYELQEAAISLYCETGEVPTCVWLQDQNDEEHEVEIDFIGNLEQCALETLQETTDECRWDDIRPIVEAILWMPKDWQKTNHDLEVN